MFSIEADRKKWNAKFSSREDILFEPEEFFSEYIDFFKPGTLLDVACGDGRNAIYFSKQGFQVTGVDISSVALERLQRFADPQFSIQTFEIDLDQPTALYQLGKFNNIIISHFKPSSGLWPILAEMLIKDGVLMCCTFNIQQHYTYGLSQKFCLQNSELTDIHPDLQLEKRVPIKRENKFLDGYIFIKR